MWDSLTEVKCVSPLWKKHDSTVCVFQFYHVAETQGQIFCVPHKIVMC